MCICQVLKLGRGSQKSPTKCLKQTLSLGEPLISGLLTAWSTQWCAALVCPEWLKPGAAEFTLVSHLNAHVRSSLRDMYTSYGRTYLMDDALMHNWSWCAWCGFRKKHTYWMHMYAKSVFNRRNYIQYVCGVKVTIMTLRYACLGSLKATSGKVELFILKIYLNHGPSLHSAHPHPHYFPQISCLSLKP